MIKPLQTFQLGKIQCLTFLVLSLNQLSVFTFFIHLQTRHVFVKHWCHLQHQSQNQEKSQSPKFWPWPTPRGIWCQGSVRNPYLNLQSRFGNLLYDLSNFKYCTLRKWDRIADWRTNRQKDWLKIQILDSPDVKGRSINRLIGFIVLV